MNPTVGEVFGRLIPVEGSWGRVQSQARGWGTVICGHRGNEGSEAEKVLRQLCLERLPGVQNRGEQAPRVILLPKQSPQVNEGISVAVFKT